MAQLKDTLVSGNLRVTDTAFADTVQVTKIKAPTTSGGTTYGPGTSGQVLKSNGTTTYWADNVAASANKLNTDAGGTYLPVYFTNGVPTEVTVKNNTALGTIGWSSGAATNAALVTVNSIAYWNGAYSGTSSNLAYCNKGAFGTIVTKNADYYLPSTTTYAGSSSVGGAANSANTLVLKELAFGSTLNTTNGLFAFTTTGAIYGSDTSDWVGMQIGSEYDRFQIMGSVGGSSTGNGTMLIRGNDTADSATGRDTNWSNWSAVMTADTIAAGTGISLSYGYWGGTADSNIKTSMTIGHSNSVGAQSVAVFKKFTYDTCGHITGIEAVTKSDIPTLDYIGAKTDGSYWGMTTPSGDETQWIRTSKRGIIPYQARSAGSGNVDVTDGRACKLGTSSYYYSQAYIENTVGSLGAYKPTLESSVPTPTGFQNDSMSYLDTEYGYGGTDYRSGNSGSNYWAHYLTFKRDSSYRYILRFPFWGEPQYQRTANGTNQRWYSFITERNLDATRLGTESSSTTMQSAYPIPRIMAPLFQFHRANKFAFMPANKITIESSTDSGSTWQTYSATDAVKRSLFINKTAGAAIMVGPKSSATRTASMRTRIIVECDGRDVIIDRLLFLISSNASSIAVDVKIALSSAPTTYIPIVTNGVASGTYAYEYIINLKHESGTETIGSTENVPKYYRFKTSNVLKFVFEFRYVSVSNTAYIGGILGYSGTYWDSDTTYTNKSYFAQHDHIYDWDVDQNATFPANVYTKSNLVSDHDLILRTSSNDDPKWYAYNDNGVNMNIIRKQGSVEGRIYTISEKSGSNLATTKLYNNGTGAASITTDSNSDQFLYFIVTVKHPGMTNSVTSVMIPASQSTSNVTHGFEWVDTPQGYTKILGGTITYKYNTSNTNYTFSVTGASQAVQAGSSGVAVTGTAVITRVMGFGLLVLGDFA